MDSGNLLPDVGIFIITISKTKKEEKLISPPSKWVLAMHCHYLLEQEEPYDHSPTT